MYLLSLNIYSLFNFHLRVQYCSITSVIHDLWYLFYSQFVMLKALHLIGIIVKEI